MLANNCENVQGNHGGRTFDDWSFIILSELFHSILGSYKGFAQHPMPISFDVRTELHVHRGNWPVVGRALIFSGKRKRTVSISRVKNFYLLALHPFLGNQVTPKAPLPWPSPFQHDGENSIFWSCPLRTGEFICR